MSGKPWEVLQFLNRIEILPAKKNGSLAGVVIETNFHDTVENLHSVDVRQVYNPQFDTEISIPFSATAVYHFDYPEEFKKLVCWHESFQEAWRQWLFLHDDQDAPEHWNEGVDPNEFA